MLNQQVFLMAHHISRLYGPVVPFSLPRLLVVAEMSVTKCIKEQICGYMCKKLNPLLCLIISVTRRLKQILHLTLEDEKKKKHSARLETSPLAHLWLPEGPPRNSDCLYNTNNVQPSRQALCRQSPCSNPSWSQLISA